MFTPPPAPSISTPLRYGNDAGDAGQHQPPSSYAVGVAGAAALTASSAYEYSPHPARAGAFERWFAWAIDLVILILITLLALIPLLGGILVAITGTGYLLMRDQGGASIGKRAMGLRVIGINGLPANRNALIIRNALLALPYLLHFIPFLGVFLTIVFWAPVCFIEAMSALITGQRIGDKMAGTIVVKG